MARLSSRSRLLYRNLARTTHLAYAAWVSLNTLACAVSAAAERIIAHPLAFIGFNVAVTLGFAFIGIDATNIAISILTADILFITALAGNKRMDKMEREIDELARVEPEIDHETIQKEIG